MFLRFGEKVSSDAACARAGTTAPSGGTIGGSEHLNKVAAGGAPPVFYIEHETFELKGEANLNSVACLRNGSPVR